MESSVNYKQAIFAISLVVVSAFPVVAADDCRPPQSLHSMSMITLRDGRMAMPVTLNEVPGTLILDSADVAEPPIDLTRNKVVPNMRNGLENFNNNQPDYAGIIGSLTVKAVQELELTPDPTGARVVGAGGDKPEEKVTVGAFSFHGLAPFRTEFLVDASGDTAADYAGTFAINNFKQFNFDFDLDFAAGTLRFFSRNHCRGQAVDWAASTIESLKFTIDGNGYIRFPVTIDGKEVSALLDTGSSITTLDFGYAGRRLQVNDDDPALTKITELADGRAIYSRTFKSIDFGDISVTDPTVILVPGMTGRGAGPRTGSRIDRDKRGKLPPLVIGMSVLKQLRVHISFDEKRLYFAQGEAVSP
jgi:hypothetical protein